MNYKYQKYIDRKSVQDKWTPKQDYKNKQFDFIISIPCYDEYDYLFKTLKSINNQNQKILDNTLVSIVINNSEKEIDEIIYNNWKTYEKILQSKFNFKVLTIDAFSKEKAICDKDAGVGMARKISVDCALKWTHRNSIICFVDADTKLNKNYLEIISQSYKNNKWKAATVNFKHAKDEPKTISYINNYEKFLKDTSKNLKKSNSPYSYIPLGSTMICNVNGYISVGGMNKKKAAEDFYFLQELQKNVNVYKINDTLVYPSSRYLNRSYLGTSTRLKKCLDGELDINSLYYSPKAFTILSKWIETALVSQNKSYFFLLEKCSTIDPDLSGFLVDLNFKKAWKGIINAPSNNHFIKQFHRWFDAFKTLKLLKYYS